MLTRQQAIRGAQNFVLIFLSIGIVALYSSWRRPIWYDEWLHFIWGSFPLSFKSVSLVWAATSREVDNCCHAAATPTYMLLNLVSLNLFGAQEWALRFPSYLSGFWILFCTVIFFRSKGFSFFWQLMSLLAVGSASSFMYYVGEARPYSTLVASVAGLTAYYTRNGESRDSRVLASIGWVSGILGTLFHPYVVFYGMALAGIFALLDSLAARTKVTFASLRQTLNLPLLTVMGGLSFFFYAFGWGKSQRSPIDPYAFFPREELPYRFALFLGQAWLSYWPVTLGMALALGSAFTLYLINVIRNTYVRDELAHTLGYPIALILCSVIVSCMLAIAAIWSGFWIMSRQWVASGYIATVAALWFAGLLIEKLRFTNSGIAGALRGLLALACAGSFFLTAYGQVILLEEYEIQKNDLGLKLERRQAEDPAQILSTSDNLEEAANLNLYVGGHVWKNFDFLYRRFETR